MINIKNQGLVIVPAGAGAGKTHRIKSTLSHWVKEKTVRPERILAVTFTEAAASELRERIRSGLLADGLVSEALAVERAYVSTIHGLGLRLLTEHALAAGASPQPRHLGDAERDLLIRQTLVQTRSLDEVKANPERFGYSANFGTGETVEDALRSRVLAMIDMLRGLGDAGRDPGLIAPALARLDKVYGPVLSDPERARADLCHAIDAMIARFPNGVAETIAAAGNRKRLEKEAALFSRIAKKPDLLDCDWAIWQTLRDLFVSNRNTKTPEGYDALANAIMSAAEFLPQHPGPLADAKFHLRCLIACAQEVMSSYEARKKSLGLIDFADMITNAERLLRTDQSVRQAVLDEIDCVIIDEFQDTNPVQFALLWHLGKHAARTLLVGDVKQSIMGFQGADPRLSVALATAYPETTDPLKNNYRSSPAVMQFVNALGQGLFGNAYEHLTPDRKAVEGTALELLNATNGRAVHNSSRPPAHIAERIARILVDGETVTDRHSSAVRRARPSDIALLVCRHTTAARYAEELRKRGVPVRIAENGWSASPAVQAARAALACAANPADIHSALVLRTLGPEPLPLQTALSLQIDGLLIDDPILMRLAALSDALMRLPVPDALNLVLQTTGMHEWAIALPEGAQARADLLRLEAEAQAFATAHRDLKAASGFHGDTAKVFLGWLDARTAERDFDRRPDHSADVAEAVEIVTWHASKGREWPITVVAEFDYDIEERPGTTATQFEALDQIEDITAVLASAKLVHTPKLAAPEAQSRFIENRRPDFESNARNLLYVALTRARDRLIIEWPSFINERDTDAPGATCLFHVLEDTCHPKISQDTLRVSGVECPADIRALPAQVGLTLLGSGKMEMPSRFGLIKPLAKVTQTPWRLNPSQLVSNEPPPATQAIFLGEPWKVGPSDAVRGTALHLAMRTYLTRPDLALALPTATGLDAETLKNVAERAKNLKEWLSTQGFPDLHCEIPVLSTMVNGAELSGTIDLLAAGPSGCLIIDHKTGGPSEGLGPYWPQLSCYGAFVTSVMPDKALKWIGIFWIDYGRIDLVSML